MVSIIRVLLALVVSTSSVGAFIPCPTSVARASSACSSSASPYQISQASSAASRARSRNNGGALRMGWGDALGKAFANEDMGAAPKNPGLKSEPKTCMVTVNGKTIKAIQGQRLRDVVGAARAKIEYGCEKGDCGTCESIVDGKKVRVCKAIVPRNKTTLTVKTKFG